VYETYREYRFAYLLLVPTLLFMILLLWLPFLRGVWMTFHEWPLGFGEVGWVGFENYAFLFQWGPFYTSLKATVIFATTTLIQLGIALAAALAVKNINWGKNILSGLFLIPYTMPPVVTGTVWLFLLKPNFGPVFGYLQQWGILDQTIYWSTDGELALTIITLVTAWTFWPFMFLVIMATLQSIPDSHYESAKVYGANRVQQLRYVTLPQLKSAILVAVSIRIIWNLSKISQPLQMTQGGPGYETSLLAVTLYRFAWNDGQLGIAFAVGIILLILVFGFVVVFIREFEREAEGA